METKPRQGRMTETIRTEMESTVIVAVVDPLNGTRAWSDPEVRVANQTLRDSAYGFGFSAPIARRPDGGRWMLLRSGWSDGTERMQHAFRLFQTGTPENLVDPRKLSKEELARIPGGLVFLATGLLTSALNHITRTGIVRRELDIYVDEFAETVETRSGGVGSVVLLQILTWDPITGDVIPSHRRIWSSFGVQWRGKLTYWSGMKLPIGKCDSHYHTEL